MMLAQSIPPIVMAGIAFYVALYQLLIYVRRRDHREHLTFGLSCLAVGLYDVFCAGLYNATSMVEGARWQRAQFGALAVVALTFLWFMVDYTGYKGRRTLYGLSVCYAAFAVIQAVDRSDLTLLVDVPAVKHVQLPLGLEITYQEVAPGIVTHVQSLLPLAVLAYILRVAVTTSRSGRRDQAVPLFAALALFGGGVLNDTLVSSGVYRFAYLIEYSYLAMILLMAYSLSNTVVEAAIAKEALRASEERFRSLVETSSDWVWEADRRGVYTYASPRVGGLLGYEPQEVVGKTPFDLMPPDEAARVRAVFDEMASSSRPLEKLENVARRKDGQIVVLETSGAPFFDASGGLLGYRGVDRDITERKQVEAEREALIGELERRNAELERFTYTVSHDLKAPLVTISGFLGYLKKDALAGNTERVEKGIQRIVQATEKMQRLLRELLELSRIGRVKNPSHAVMFADIVEDALRLAHGRLEARGVRVEVTPDLPLVHGDRARLVEVVQNLLDNACNFMGDQAAPRITIGQQGLDGEGKRVLFVRDNGVGIDPRHHDRVFGLFEKLDPHSEGTGIGLALVKRIVEVHGGRVWVESERGRGATFFFTI